jgi:hypothetical protein
MTYSQEDRLDRIQHTLLPTTEKDFIENKRKCRFSIYFFGRNNLCYNPISKIAYFGKLKIFGKKIIRDNLGDFDSVISQQSNDTKTIARVQLYEELWAFEVDSTQNSHN